MRYLFLILTALFAWTAQGQTTFNVDMTCAPAGFTDVFVTGPWCGWCANDVYNTMTDADGDGIYTVTLDSTVTGLIEYKYAINGFADKRTWSMIWWMVRHVHLSRILMRMLIVKSTRFNSQ